MAWPDVFVGFSAAFLAGVFFSAAAFLAGAFFPAGALAPAFLTGEAAFLAGAFVFTAGFLAETAVFFST
ncbi:MAG: hypothetical protein ACREUM_09670, partial [Nitrosospira sp.]